tara:strand:- start:348 stop:635 length:288 start_codon:yes stop_codon:yes gene_type:complete
MTHYVVYFVTPRANGLPDVWTLSRPYGAPAAYDSLSDAEDAARECAAAWPKGYVDREWAVVRQVSEEFEEARFIPNPDNQDHPNRKFVNSRTSRI